MRIRRQNPLRLLTAALNDTLSSIEPHWLILAILMRILVSPISMHVDRRFVGDPVVLAYRSILYLSDSSAFSRYPPLYPRPFYYSFAWILHFSARISSFFLTFSPFAAGALDELLEWPGVFRFLTLVKAMNLVFDMAITLLLGCLCSRRRSEVANISLFWLFNPITWYTAYFHGQVDLVPLFFVVLSLSLASRGEAAWAVLSVGIGACYKLFPFLFLPVLVLVGSRSWRRHENVWWNRLLLTLLGIGPYLLVALPSVADVNPNIGNYSSRFFVGGYDLGPGTRVYFFFVFYAVVLWYLEWAKAYTFGDIWRACFVILLVYYQFSSFDLHYWAWAIPFAAIYWTKVREDTTALYTVVLVCLFVLVTPTPLARFLAPVSPALFLRLPSLFEALSPYLPMMFIVNVVRSVLAGTCFCLAWKLLCDMPASTSLKVGHG